MVFDSAVRQCARRLASHGGSPPAAQATRLCHPLCESLETRLLLSVATYQNPTWFKPWQPYAVGTDPIAVQVADLGNGHPDIVALNAGSSAVSVLLGNGSGTFQPQRAFPAGVGATTFANADVNHDGKPDLIVADFDGVAGDTGTITVLLGNGDGTFAPPQNTIPAGPDPLSIAIADFNGDGNPDVAVANSGTNPDGSAVNTVSVLLGNGNGTFQPAYTLSTDLAPEVVTAADLNRDGKVDLIVGGAIPGFSANKGPVDILLGNGDGSFQPEQTISGFFGDARSIAVADLNGDGKLDLVMGSIQDGDPSDVMTALGNGDGTFQAANWLYPARGNFVATADVTGNGRPGILALNRRDSDFQALINLYNAGDGSPYFATTGPTENTSDPNQFMSNSPVSLAVADLNGDGKPDVVTADSGDNTVGVFINSSVKPSLAPRVVSAKFNGPLINGNPAPGIVSVSLTNTSPRTWVTGVALLDVFACANGDVNPDQTVIAEITLPLNIGPGQSVTAQLPTDRSATSQLPIGAYTLLAEVTDPYGNTIDETVGPKLRVSPLVPILPPPNPSDTFSQVIGSAHGVTVPLVWTVTGGA
jgi:hypothetical protein